MSCDDNDHNMSFCEHRRTDDKRSRCVIILSVVSVLCSLFLLILTSVIFRKGLVGETDTIDISSAQCGYSSCPAIKDGYINVHIIPHTHDDVGWLKTLDQYYYGSKPLIQKAGVQYIIDSVVQELNRDPNRRFIYVETSFFWKWWQQQSEHDRHIVKRLVANGQLEFIGGAWSMHDEATTHYQSIIDQFTWGFRRLNDTFGKCGVPRVGWQIDPFGHSRQSASIMAGLGFDGLFLGRIDYRDKGRRLQTKEMEMIWETSPNIGIEADLFTGILYNNYGPPKGFCFDVLCAYEPIIDDENSPEYNADKRAEEFEAEVLKQLDSYKTPNIAVTMGGDFTYQNANYYLVNLDRLIRAVNSRQDSQNTKINLLYSTPSCYLKALNEEGRQWLTKQDDFFPYASNPHAFWTGYFTSRPTLKYYERTSNNFLQVCKQLSALSNLEPNEAEQLNVLREAMGVMQHHDAITGTEKQHVAFDYARQLSEGYQKSSIVAESALNKLMAKASTSPSLPVTSCLLLNISHCEVSETHDTFVVTLYNPLSRKVSRYIRLPVAGDGQTYSVRNPQGQPVPVQVVPVPEPVITVPGRFSVAQVELVFLADELPPLGFRSYFVSPGQGLNSPIAAETIPYSEFTFGFLDSLSLTIDGKTGIPTALHSPGMSNRFQQNFFYYKSARGNNAESKNRSSGAYIFRPDGTKIPINPQPTIKYYKGPLVEEVHQQFSSWVSQVIRAYKGENLMEFNWMVGPIPTDDGIGKEIVTRYSVVGLKTNLTFYTDSNGREMLKRVVNERTTYNLTLEEPIAANYYPVTTRISVTDEQTQFSVITDRAQGGSSLRDGEMELMLHRRILHDDGYGVEEALEEEAYGEGLVARGSHYLTGGPASSQTAVDRRLVQEKVLSTWTFLTPTTLTFEEWCALYNMEWLGLKTDLPESVQILTLEPWKDSSFLLRLEHILEKGDDQTAAQPVTVNLQEIFKPFAITWVRETSLGANQWQDEVSRLVWTKEDNNETLGKPKTQNLPTVILSPMDIKSFIIKVAFII